jgi:hypothetical protein
MPSVDWGWINRRMVKHWGILVGSRRLILSRWLGTTRDRGGNAAARQTQQGDNQDAMTQYIWHGICLRSLVLRS